MRGWVAVAGLLLGIPFFLGGTRAMFPSDVIAILIGLGLILGSVVYAVVAAGLIRGVCAILSAFLGLFLIGVGVWILRIIFQVLSILIGLALIVVSS